MKKLLIFLAFVSLLVLPVVSVVGTRTTPSTVVEPRGDVIEVLDRIVDWLFYILLFAAALMIVVSAYYFVTASGNPESVKTARSLVLYAVIGIVVAFLAKGVVYLVLRMIGYTGAYW